VLDPSVKTAGVDVRFSPDGRYLAVTTLDRAWSLALFRLDPNAPPQLIRRVPIEQIVDLAFSQDGTLLAISPQLGAVTVWETEPWRQRFELRPGHQGEGLEAFYPGKLAFSMDGRMLAVDSIGTLDYVWDLDTGRELAVIRRRGNTPSALAFSQDSQFLLVAEPGRSTMHIERPRGVEVWRIATAQKEQFFDTPQSHVALDPSGALAAWVADAQQVMQVMVWDLFRDSRPRHLAPIRTEPRRDTEITERLTFSADGQFVLGEGLTGVIYVWRVSDGALVYRLDGGGSGIRTLTHHPSRGIVVALYLNGELRSWQVPPIP
jgi:WD40 repeat protein